MSTFGWIQQEQELSPAALTVLAQTVSPNDTGRLWWDSFMPRKNVNSVDLKEIYNLDDRYVADRREWNARGRLIPQQTPSIRDLSMVPVESYFKIEEKELQRLAERTLGNESIFREIIRADIPERTVGLAEADYRRIEFDVMRAWALGTIIQRNPQDASKTVTYSYGFSSSRYQTAATPWNDGGVNAYDEFLAWLLDGVDSIGGVEGAVMRLATYNAILADAPDLPNGVAMTRSALLSRLQDDIGGPFEFVIIEDSHDVFDDGGTAVTRTKVWPAEQVAAIPSGGVVGYTGFAPVRRAMELSRLVPEAGIDVRGCTVYHEESNGGRELTVEAQINAFPVPQESKLWLIDAGV